MKSWNHDRKKLRILLKREKGIVFLCSKQCVLGFCWAVRHRNWHEILFDDGFFRSQPQIFETEYLLANGTYDGCSWECELGISLEIGSCYVHKVCFNILRLWYSSKMVLDELVMSRHPKGYSVHGNSYHEFWQVRVVSMITDIWYISFLKHHLYDYHIIYMIFDWYISYMMHSLCLCCSRCCRWNDVSTAKAWNAPSSIFRPLRCDERWKVGETRIVLRDRFLAINKSPI